MRQDFSIALRVSNRYIEAMRASERETLVGEGVELRRHDRANYPLYARWYGDEEIWRLTSWAAQPLTRAEVERLFEDREGSSVNDSFAIHREGEEEPLGVISLVNINEANDSAELSVIVGDEQYRNKGLGTEAIRVILRHAFEDLGLERVGLSVFEFNEAAIQAYEKLGFKRESRMQQAIRRDGTLHDAILMRVRAHEWSASET
jgi:RimJ/RimL family protein N-acetyltransferase